MEHVIRIIADGPYEVTKDVPVEQMDIHCNEEGAALDWENKKNVDTADMTDDGVYHLCRCGHSKNKPFCDGTHTSVKFVARELSNKKPYKEEAVFYKGPAVDMLDNEKYCAVARFCDRGESVWVHVEKSDNPELKDLAVYEATMCPSGRLTVCTKDGKPIEPQLEYKITPVRDPFKNSLGPYFVQGGVTLEGADGEAYEVRNRMTLCRCGESRNMPFCDASHLACPHMQMDEQ